MTAAPHSALAAAYRWVVRLAPASHRRVFGDEQLAVFEDVWIRERPDGRLARSWFAAQLLLRGLIASLGVHVDQGRSRHPGGGGRQMGSDFWFTLRAAGRSPWYSATVVGVAAVTIALATATLAVVDGVLLRPLPYPSAHELVRILPDFAGLPTPPPLSGGLRRVFAVSPVDLEEWQRAVPEVPITAYRAQPWAGLGPGVNDDAAGVGTIQANFFDVIGVRPLLGGFTADDFSSEARLRPVIAMYDVWQVRFAGRADVVGESIVLDRASGSGVRVVGVMPRGFVFPSTAADVSFLTPMVQTSQAKADATDRSMSEVLARLPESMSPAMLTARLSSALPVVAARFPPRGPKPDGWSDAGWRRQGPYDAVTVRSLRDALQDRSGAMFRAAMLAVILLVLVAAANISSLMTARALERERELAVRRSLGAGTLAIARLWAIEAGVLLFVAAMCGAGVAPLLLQVVLPLLPDHVVLLKTPGIDWRVVAIVVVAVAVLVALVSVAPIRRSLRPSSDPSWRGASERTRSLGRGVVIAGQVAVAFALTIVGVSLVGSVLAVYAEEQPVATEDVVALSMLVSGGQDGQQRSLRVNRLREQLLQIPGVTGAAASGAQVLVGGGALPEFIAPKGTTHRPDTDAWPVTEGFYETLAPQLLEGRLPTAEELRSSAPVVVLSHRAASAYWPDASPIGRTLVHYWSKTPHTVIGVVRDVRWLSWDMESPIIYAPYNVSRYSWVTLFLRTSRPSRHVIEDATAVVSATDGLMRIRRAGTLQELFRDTIALRRFQSWLFGSFAVAALAVVGAGLLGLLAMSAARRTREVGIRSALGATPRSIVGQLVREQMANVLIGLSVGAAVAAWSLSIIRAWLYQLTPADPRIWTAGIACVLAMAAVGVLIPALRASRVDPVQALRLD